MVQIRFIVILVRVRHPLDFPAVNNQEGEMAIKLQQSAESFGLLLLRISLGTIFIAHGSQKLFGAFGGYGLTATFKAFEEKLGIPPILTVLAIIAEFGGGIGVLCGFLTRLSALGIASVMAVAIYKVHAVNGFFLNIECVPGKGPGIEYNVALIGMALALVFTGAGAWAIDRLIWRK
jgi:putative oxidoreductase